MTLEQVKLLRELYKPNLIIFADNAKIYNTNSEKTHIIWDDANELVHVIKTNTNFYTQKTTPIFVESLSYEVIEYIGSAYDEDNLTKVLNQFKTMTLIDDEKITVILDDMFNKKKEQDKK